MPWLLFALVALALLAEVIRLRNQRINSLVVRLLMPVIRLDEQKNLMGATYIAIAALCVALFFSKEIAVAALCFLALGDGGSAAVKELLPKTNRHVRLIRGALCLCLCVAVAFGLHAARFETPLSILLLGAIVATVVERFSLGINDNLAMPLASGGVMWLLLLCR